MLFRSRRALRDRADVDARVGHCLGEGGTHPRSEGHALPDDGHDRVARLEVHFRDEAAAQRWPVRDDDGFFLAPLAENVEEILKYI